MRINDLYKNHESTREVQLLRASCSQFFTESSGLPLLKNLSCAYADFHKVKVRKRKGESGDFTETFNEAFESQHPGLRQRAIFANGVKSFQPIISEEFEPFYVFPIDGYQFMYSKEVENSGHEYKQVFETLFEQFGEQKGNEVLTDLLRFTYTSKALNEGIESGSEIIIYGIPYFYAMRTTAIDEYSDLLSHVLN
jgi:hypothetical protein